MSATETVITLVLLATVALIAGSLVITWRITRRGDAPAPAVRGSALLRTQNRHP